MNVDACTASFPVSCLRVFLHQVEGIIRKRHRLKRKRFFKGQSQVKGVQLSSFMESSKKPVPLVEKLIPVLPGVDVGWGVRQNGQSRRFSPGQFFRRPAEIPPGRGLESYHISSERGVGCVQGKNPSFGRGEFQPGRKDGFDDFLTHRPFLAPRHPDYLHSDRASTGSDPAGLDVSDCSTADRNRIHTEVVRKPPVFELYHGLLEFFRDSVGGWKPPLAVIGNPCPEQFSVPVRDHCGIAGVLEQISWQTEEVCGNQNAAYRNDSTGPFPHVESHLFTVALPEALLPCRKQCWR